MGKSTSIRNIAKMSAESIKALVSDDFGVKISTIQANEIKEAARNGALMWTDSHLITTDSSGIRINRT